MAIRSSARHASPQADALASSETSPPFLFTVQVWGKAYTRLLIDVLLPCTTTAGNLGVFDRSSEFRIYTTAADAPTIESSIAYCKLASMVTAHIELIDDSFGSSAHDIMSECQRRAARAAAFQDMPVVFLAPDTSISDCMFSRIRELWCAGYRAVMLPSIRVSEQTFVPALLAAKDASSGTLAVQPRELVRFMLDHLHPISKCLFWDSPTFTVHPSHVYWTVGTDGLLAMCAHIHPIMVHAVGIDINFNSTIDGDYVPKAVPDFSQIYVVTDSDDMMIVEISSDTQLLHPILPNQFDVGSVVHWVGWATNHYHRYYMGLNFRFHANNLDERWQAVEADCERVRSEVRALLDLHELGPSKLLGTLLRLKLANEVPVLKLLGNLLRLKLADKWRIFVDRVCRSLVYGCTGPNILHPGWLQYRQIRRLVDVALNRPTADVLFAGGLPLRADRLDVMRKRQHKLTRFDIVPTPVADIVVDESAQWNWPNESFDVVICLNFLERCRSSEKAIAEMKRVLRRGGSLIVFGATRYHQDRTPAAHCGFTLEHLMEIVAPEIEVTQSGRIGSILNRVDLYWLSKATGRSHLDWLILHPLVLPFYCPAIIAFNALSYCLNLACGSRLGSSHVFISGQRRAREAGSPVLSPTAGATVRLPAHPQ